jgi:hypothetical protein
MDRPSIGARPASSGLALLLLLGLAGCSGLGGLSGWFRGGEPVPGEAGLYALVGPRDDAELQRLNGAREWELETWRKRSDLDPDIGFAIRHPALAEERRPPEQVVHLRRVAWVRSSIAADGQIGPAPGERWAVPTLESFEVPLRIQPAKDRKDVVYAIPTAPLKPGIYSLELDAGDKPERARLGVGWPSVDQRAYSAATCVDRYEGRPPRYLPCAEQKPVAAAKVLRFHLVDPELRDGEQGQVLVVKGVVVNTSKREQPVPPLEAQLRTADGAVLSRWRFDAGIGALKPGASASFSTELQSPPPGGRSVYVAPAFAAQTTERTPR